MYVCGPTVSGESHLGHARPFISFDIIFRYLLHLGYKVRYVRNITDAGHFEEEGREAEDKITKKAKLEYLEPMELVHKYTRLFHQAMNDFNNLPPSIEPTATGHIVEQIEMIKKIIDKGYAYVVNGSVYFDVIKYAHKYEYGKLSGRIVDDLLQNTRDLVSQNEKRNSADFALWKKAPPEHIMRWQSPWGEGFPGWHIECSAMSLKYLGEFFDIHGGGMDLLFPHHESEIAQTSICCDREKPQANYWVYNNMITINGKKMSKSYNNQIKLSDLFSGNHPELVQAYSPMTVRFFILQTHYRSTLDFSNDALQAAEKGLTRLMSAYQTLMQLPEINLLENTNNTAINTEIHIELDSFQQSMNADFNTAKVIASMFNLATKIHSLKDGHLPLNHLTLGTLQRMKLLFNTYLKDILGLQTNQQHHAKTEDLIKMIVTFRNQLKAKKDYAGSDAIRNQLQNLGIILKDEKSGGTSYQY